MLGRGTDASGNQTFVWTQSKGMTLLGIPAAGAFSAVGVRAISGDGTVFVGSGSTASVAEAFRWSAAEGLAGLGDLPGGAFNSTAAAVSPDGSVIVGRSGIEPSRDFHLDPAIPAYEPFIAHLPEPGALALVVVGMVALVRRQRM